jgi:hypothetical protein
MPAMARLVASPYFRARLLGLGEVLFVGIAIEFVVLVVLL